VLGFTPKKTRIRLSFDNQISFCFSWSPSVADNWDTQLKSLKSTAGTTNSIAISPDGRLIACAAMVDVDLRDSSPGALRCRFGWKKGSWSDADYIIRILFSADGHCIATVSRNALTRIWDTTGTLLAFMEDDIYGPDYLLFSVTNESVSYHNVDFLNDMQGAKRPPLPVSTDDDVLLEIRSHSPDGTIIAFRQPERTKVTLWDKVKSVALQTLEVDNNDFHQGAFSLDNLHFAIGFYTGAIKIWSVGDGTLQHHLRSAPAGVCSLAYSPDGTKLACGCDDNMIRICDVVTESFTSTLRGHRGAVTGVVWYPDGKTLVSASSDHTVRLWDTRGSQLGPLQEGHKNQVIVVQVSPDGKIVATLCTEGVKLWDAETRALTHSLLVQCNETGSRRIQFSEDRRFLVHLWQHTCHIWDILTGHLQCAIRRGRILSPQDLNPIPLYHQDDDEDGSTTTPFPDVRFSPTSEFVFLVYDRAVRFWSLAARSLAFSIEDSPAGHSGSNATNHILGLYLT
jgi:WD40 repeat protein